MSCGCVRRRGGFYKNRRILNELGVLSISPNMQWMSVQTGAAAANTAGMILAVPAAPPAEFVEDIGQRAPHASPAEPARAERMHA